MLQAARRGSGRLWWVLFAALIAGPALTLALLGLRAARVADLERARHLQDERLRVGRLADVSLAGVLDRIESELAAAAGSARTLRDYEIAILEPSGRFLLPRENLSFDAPGTAAAPSGPRDRRIQQTIERALAAEAQQNPKEALPLYDELARLAPALRNWAELARAHTAFHDRDFAQLPYVTDSRWSLEDQFTPGGVPLAVLAAGYVEDVPPARRRQFAPLIRASLERLRAGQWELRPAQRASYDDELRRLLSIANPGATAGEDPRLAEWAGLEALVRRQAPLLNSGLTRHYASDGHLLTLWARSRAEPGTWLGAVIAGPRLTALLESVLRPLLTGEEFQGAVAQLDGAPVWNSFPGGVRAGFRQPLAAVPGWQILLSDPPEPSALESRRLLWYGVVAVALVMLAGGVIGTAAIVRREMELARLQAEFLGGITHEFKSPITSIRLLIERLSGGRLHAREGLAEYYQAIARETERLERLVNRVLESQKIQTGRRHYSFLPASIVELVEASIGRLKDHAEAKDIALCLDTGSQIPEVMLDQTAVADALDNLLDNAIKYSPRETRIDVRVTHEERQVTVAVRDRGMGIDAADLPRIFERFYRGRRAERNAVPGTGLGLALVKATAEAHGGAVDAANAPDGGACFRLRLPVRQESHA